jgi:transposase
VCREVAAQIRIVEEAERSGPEFSIKGEQTLAELAQQFDVRANQIIVGQRQLQKRAADVFGAGGTASRMPLVDLKELHAKIGQLTVENNFLSGALNKAGLLSAKR